MTDLRRPELHRLAVPFPAKFVSTKQGASYVNHAIVQQRLLGTVGPFSMRVEQVIRGDFDEKVTRSNNKERTWPARTNAVVGVVLTCTFTIDGQQVEVSEVGTPEGHYMAEHDGERLKKAMSDALKRCAMRVGVGLDLWSKGAYVLPGMLEKDTVEVEQDAAAPNHDAPDPDDVPDGVDPETGEIIDSSTAGDREAPAVEGTTSGEEGTTEDQAPATKPSAATQQRVTAEGDTDTPGTSSSPDPVDAHFARIEKVKNGEVPSPAGPVPEGDGPFDWRHAAVEAGVKPAAVFIGMVKGWPSNDQLRRPKNPGALDELVVSDPIVETEVRTLIGDLAGGAS